LNKGNIVNTKRHTKALLTRVFALAVVLGAQGAAYAQEKLTFNMSWLPQGPAIGPIIAAEKGWFKDAGLDVSIIRGYGGARTASELDRGVFEVGYVDPIVVFQNRLNGGKIKMIGAINTKLPASFCYIKGKREPKRFDDLRGLTLGTPPSAPAVELVPAIAESNGKPRNHIQLVRLDPAVVSAAFIEGKVDLLDCWAASSREVAVKQAKQAGVSLGWLNYSDLGIDGYGSGFAARDELIASKPEMLRKFLKASYRGFELAIAQPEEALKSLVKQFPGVDPEIAMAQIKAINELIVDPAARQQGLGYLRPDRMRATLEFTERAYNAKGKTKVEDLYTNALQQ
jgi:NitT/TauT family transport system substrate-binding protein